MIHKSFSCECCKLTFSRMVSDAVLTAVCPTCGKVAKLVRLGLGLGLSFSEAVVAILGGYALYRLLRE